MSFLLSEQRETVLFVAIWAFANYVRWLDSWADSFSVSKKAFSFHLWFETFTNYPARRRNKPLLGLGYLDKISKPVLTVAIWPTVLTHLFTCGIELSYTRSFSPVRWVEFFTRGAGNGSCFRLISVSSALADCLDQNRARVKLFS